jgi:HlyD family secretion protein
MHRSCFVSPLRNIILRSILRSLFTCTLLSIFLVGCSHSDSNKLQGYVEGEFVYVSSSLGGTLESLHVSRGQQVKVGDQLFELDSTAEKAALSQAQAALIYSQSEFERQERLMQTMGATSKGEYERSRSLRDQDKERVTKAHWDLSQKSQIAPQAGVIFDTLYRAGEWVVGGHPVVAILAPQNIKVRAFIPEPRIARIHLGDAINVLVDGIGNPIPGKVSFVSPQAEYTPPVIYSRESRDKLVFMIEIVFDLQTSAKLHPGQPVDVQPGA